MQYLTIKEAVDMNIYSMQHLRLLIKQNKVNYKIHNKKYYIERDSLLTYKSNNDKHKYRIYLNESQYLDFVEYLKKHNMVNIINV